MLGNFWLIEDLLCLSQKADDMIDKALADMDISDNFFEETKSKIGQIANGKIQKKNTLQVLGNGDGYVKFQNKNICDILVDIRAHVHPKNNKSGGSLENKCNENSEKTHESQQIVESSVDENTSCSPSKVDSNCNSIKEKNVSVERQDLKLGHHKMLRKTNDANRQEISPSKEIEKASNKSHSTSIDNSKVSEKRRSAKSFSGRKHLRSNKRKELETMSISTEEFLKGSGVSLEIKTKKVISVKQISKKPFLVNTDLEKENNITVSEKSDDCCTLMCVNEEILQLNETKNSNKTEAVGEGKYSEENPSLSARGMNLIVCVKETLDEVSLPSSLNEKRNSSSGYESSSRTSQSFDKTLKIANNHSTNKSSSNPILCNAEKKHSLRSVHRSPTAKAHHDIKKSHASGNKVNEVFNNGQRSNSAGSPEIQTYYLQFKKNKESKKLLLSRDSQDKQGSVELRKRGSKIKLFEQENLPHGTSTTKWLDKTFTINTKQCRNVRTESIPVCHGKIPFSEQTEKPCTPVKNIAKSNRHPLKAKAEEKRRLREIREQKTKEKRERLEKERAERIRLSQDKLKRRFVQHEEKLREKKEKFKIKSKSRQQGCVVSTSSENSKEDRTKDNDDFCRNAADSGQKLSKEGDGYIDVQPKKAGLAAAEGNAGCVPGIAVKKNSIPVGCKKTPAECLGTGNSLGMEKTEMVSKSPNSKRLKSFKESATVKTSRKEPCLSGVSKSGSIIKRALCETITSVHSSTKRQRQSSESSGENNYKTPKFSKKENTLTDKSQFQTYVKKNQSSYMLRSQEKKPGYYQECNTQVSSMITNNEHKSNSDIVKPTSQKNKRVFKLKRSERLKRSANFISKSLSISKNSSVLTRSQKRCLKKDSVKDNKSKTHINKLCETNEILSYIIPDDAGNNSEEEKIDPKHIPLWAQGLNLKQALIYQYYSPPNVEDIFGELPNEAVDLVSIFGRNKLSYHQRTSSNEWSSEATPN